MTGGCRFAHDDVADFVGMGLDAAVFRKFEDVFADFLFLL